MHYFYVKKIYNESVWYWYHCLIGIECSQDLCIKDNNSDK